MNMRVGGEPQPSYVGTESTEGATGSLAFRTGTRDTQSTSQTSASNTSYQKANAPELPPPSEFIDPVHFLSSLTNFLQLTGQDETGQLNNGVAENKLFSKPLSNISSTQLTDRTDSAISKELDEEGDAAAQADQRVQYSKDFTQELINYAGANDLSDEDMQKLQFAFFNPEAALTGNAANGQPLADVLKTVLSQAQQTSLANGVDVSKLNPPINNSDYNLNVSDGYNAAFEKLVEQDSTLTADQKGQLLFMHYNPNSSLPNTPKALTDALKNFENQALLQAQQKFGAPSDWKPTLNSELYNGVLTSQFGINLQMSLNAYASDHSVSSDDLALIKQSIEDPNADVPPNIKSAAQEILNQAIGDTKIQNNLPIDWQPVTLKNVFTDIANDKIASAFMNAREMVSDAIKTVKLLMPDGPQKQRTLDLLQSISAAIILMQKTIYEVQQAHSETAKAEAMAKKGTQDLQIRLQDEQNKEVAEQLKKQQSLGVFMAIFGPIMKVFEFLMTLATGGVLGAVFAILDSQFSFVQKGIEAVMKGVAEIVDKMFPNPTNNPDIERLKHGLTAFAKIMTIVAMAYAATSAAGSVLMNMLGPQQIINLTMKMVTESGIVQDFSQMVGIPKEAANYVNMAVGIAMTLAICIVSVANPAAGAAKVGALVEDAGRVAIKIATKVADVLQSVINSIKSIKILATILSKLDPLLSVAKSAATVVGDAVKAVVDGIKSVAKAVSNALRSVMNSIMGVLKKSDILTKAIETFEKLLQKIVDDPDMVSRLLKGFDIAKTTLGIAASGVQGGMNISQAKVSLSKAKYEPEVAELQQMIKTLQKMIDSLIEGLSGFGDQLTELKGMFDNLLSSLSQTLQKTTSIQS